MWQKIKKKLIKEKKENSFDFLIVGLGNPGEKYKDTVHNCGFRVVSLFQENYSFPSFKKDNTLNGLLSKGEIEDKKIALFLPLLYMNLSGDPVKRVIKRLGIDLEKIILVHDDIDLPIGTLRFSTKRGSAGHKGVSSVIKSLKTNNFSRLRIGARKEEEKAKKVVLKKVPSSFNEIEEIATKELKTFLLSENQSKTIIANKKEA